jgi:DNA-binding CsgD family transcriptional regulator
MDEAPALQGLFGRDDALEVVRDVLTGGGSLLAIGDPGVGKSSLLQAANQLAQGQGRTVLSVTPTQFDRGLPFAGLVELISQCPKGCDDGLPEPQQRALAVALHRVQPTGASDALAVPLAVRGLLTQLCEGESVTLLIDDLQWLDHASIGSLGFALRRIAVDPLRLTVLVATRPEGSSIDLVRDLAEPRHEFSLQPLEDGAIGQLLRHRLGSRWTPPMSAGVAQASAGNPLLALEIARAMQAGVRDWHGNSQQRHDSAFPVPPSLGELLHERVSQLPDEARAVLLLASAAGRLTVAQLGTLFEESTLLAALEAAADADVATVNAESAVTFTHPLLASAVHDAAAPTDRRRAHRVLAEALEDPVERARHRARSISAPDETIAEELERAAAVSKDRGALILAGELFEGAALATPTTADAAAGLRRWLSAVDSYIAAGDGVAAQVALDSGAPLAATPEQQAEVLVRRLRLVDHYSGVRSLAEEAARIAPEGSEVRAQILSILGLLHRMQGHGDEALEATRMAVAEAAASGRPDIQLEALNNRLAVEWHWAQGRPEETLREIEQLVDRAPLDPSAMWVVWTKGFFATWKDERAEQHVRDGIRAPIKDGRYGDLSFLLICLVLFLIRSSRVRDAQAALDESDRLGAWAGSTLQEDMARILVTEYAGDLMRARELAQSAVERSRASGSTYWRAGFLAQLAFIEVSAQNWSAALEVTRELERVFRDTGIVDLEQLLWAVDYADAALQCGVLEDLEIAVGVLRRQAFAGRLEAAAAADRCHAMLLAARGDLDGALSELREVVDRQGAECPFEAGRSLLALGQVYRRAGHKGAADEALQTAASAFDDLGIPRWADRARSEAGRVGLRPTKSHLTETERRIAELVGAGRSNHETAAELFMSVKTVEANLTRIYRKLEVRSRTELANRMATIDSVPGQN